MAGSAVGGGCTGEVDPIGAPTGFRVDLEHEERPAPGPAGAGQVAWESAWTLSWASLPGASSYAVYYGTSEGAGGGGPQRSVRQSSLRIQAAAGTSPLARLSQDRSAGLRFTSSALLVSVAGVGPDGEGGPRSPWFPVGDVPADGEPIGTMAIGTPSGPP